MLAPIQRSAQRSRPSAFEWFARLYLVASLGLVANVVNMGFPALGSLFNVIWASLYAVTLVFLANSLAHGGFSVRSWIAVLAALLPAASPIWSALPEQSLVQGVGLAANIAFAVVLARRMSLSEIVASARWALNAMLVLSLIAVVVSYPSAYYYDGLQRSSMLGMPPLQGMFTHKISLGVYSALALGLNLATLRGRQRLGFSALALFFALASGSSTSLVAVMVVLFLNFDIAAARRTKLRGAFNLPVLFVVLGVAIAGISQYEEILTGLGRDTTLTGRTELWQWAITFFKLKPIVGWGYGGIFNDIGPAPSDIFFNGDYRAPHFHSGYLQVLAEMGLTGFSLTLIVLVSVIVRAYRGAFHSSLPEYAAVLIFFGTLIPVYFAMNILMRYNDFSTVLLIAIFLARPTTREQAQAPAQRHTNIRQLSVRGST